MQTNSIPPDVRSSSHVQSNGTPIEIQLATELPVPTHTDFETWVSCAMESSSKEICVRVMDRKEASDLNRRYRNRDDATNVLAFPTDEPDRLGDIAICSEITNEEARNQGKSLNAHYAHLVVHGVLHLQGYDHQSPQEAKRMQAKEVELLTSLGISNPYL